MSKYETLIKAIIYKAPRHLTAEEIFFELKQQEPKVVLATIYNNLKSMHQKGLIHKVTTEGMPDRYDRIERHDHLLCAKCGCLSDIKFQDITRKLEEQLGQAIVSYDLRVNYICPSCQKKE